MIFDFFSNKSINTVKTSALMAVESAVNKALEYDPATQQSIGELAGKVLAIECTMPPLTFYGLINYGIGSETDITLLGQYEGDADTTLKGSALSLATLAIDGQDRVSFFDTGVEVRGDHDLLRQIRKILKNLDIDWEDALSQLIGDVPAHLIGESLRRSTQWKKDTVTRAASAAAEFSQEEVRLTPSKNEVDHFNGEVKHLTNDVDRLGARINKLKILLDQQSTKQDSTINKTPNKNREDS